jgi:hypothetical protein
MELQISLIDANWCLPVRWRRNRSISVPDLPYVRSLERRMEWLHVTKAFYKSQKITIGCFFKFKELDK